jgi:alkylhydroperoxidase family enzyme
MSTATTAPRLSLINPETASKPIKDALALLPVINVFRALANAESLYPYFSNYLLQLFRPMELDKALERMIVLHVARRSDCIYAWRQNVVVGHSVGVTDEQIAALEKGEIKASCFSEAEQAAFAFTNEVMDLIEATDTYGFLEHDHVVKTFSSNRSNQPFDIGILPRRSRSSAEAVNAYPLGHLMELVTVASVTSRAFLIGQSGSTRNFS